jgi:hypothetical protein
LKWLISLSLKKSHPLVTLQLTKIKLPKNSRARKIKKETIYYVGTNDYLMVGQYELFKRVQKFTIQVAKYTN